MHVRVATFNMNKFQLLCEGQVERIAQTDKSSHSSLLTACRGPTHSGSECRWVTSNVTRGMILLHKGSGLKGSMDIAQPTIFFTRPSGCPGKCYMIAGQRMGVVVVASKISPPHDEPRSISHTSSHKGNTDADCR